jgi:hypothetical protein
VDEMHLLGIVTRRRAAGNSAERGFCPVLLIGQRGVHPLQVLLEIEVPISTVILEDCVAAEQV